MTDSFQTYRYSASKGKAINSKNQTHEFFSSKDVFEVELDR